MNVETIVGHLGKAASRREAPDGLWLLIPSLDARHMAEVMRDSQIARLCTITGVEDDSGIRLIYHWDVDGALLNVTAPVQELVAASIADIWPAADWVEREIHDYYGVEFSGRAETPPLMLRDGDEPGLFARTRSLSPDTDPADTGWSERLGNDAANAEQVAAAAEQSAPNSERAAEEAER